MLLPGYNPYDHFRASRDLRESPRLPSDPADPWIGEWDVLAAEALHADDRAIISNELLVASSPQQADRAMRSLLHAEVHLVVTLRDFASLLPAEWQESVKVRGTTGWGAWLDEVIATERVAQRRRHSWFWRVHETLANLDMWSQHIPPQHVHVVTVPRQGSGDSLWGRFASAMGIDPTGFDLSQGRRNSSLGFAETEFLRRVNQELPDELPEWFYTREIKKILAHGVLRDHPQGPRLPLPTKHAAWAAEQAESLIAGLGETHYHLVGNLTELRPADQAGSDSEPPGQSAEEQFETAVQAVVALTGRCYEVQQRPPAATRPASVRQRAADIKWTMLNGPRVRRVLCQWSNHAAARRLRVMIWRVLIRPGGKRR